jgi:hypothetical protein
MDATSLLSKLYYDPKTGFIGANKLYKKAKELIALTNESERSATTQTRRESIDKNITLKQVYDWYKTQTIIQEHSNEKKRYPEFKIASDNPNEWQIDLAFWEKQLVS